MTKRKQAGAQLRQTEDSLASKNEVHPKNKLSLSSICQNKLRFSSIYKNKLRSSSNFVGLNSNSRTS